MVSRTLCVCTCMCVLSLLAGTLTLLKLLFYGHCESLWFSELLLLFFPPSLAAGCILCHKRFCEGLCSGYGVSNLNLHFGPPAKSLLALSKKGVKKRKRKEKMKKDILTNVCKTDPTSIASLGMSSQKGIAGVRPGRENMKRHFTPKPNTDFLHERGWVGETHHIESWPI